MNKLLGPMATMSGAGASRVGARLPFLKICLVAATACVMAPGTAAAQIAPAQVQSALKSAGKSAQELRPFYATRGFRPLWVRGATIGPEADELLKLIGTAYYDGLDPDAYKPRALASAIRNGREGSPKALAKAEAMLSQTLAAYVRDVRRPRDSGMIYVDRELAPTVLKPSAVLSAAASAPSLDQYLKNLGWMHPVYGQLRETFSSAHEGRRLNHAQEMLLRINMDRARALPSRIAGRHILVDAAAAQLYLYEDGRVVDTMNVIVGKPDLQTPMMAGLIRFAMVNPYWNIPPDLVRDRIAPRVLDQGVSYLRARRYDVLNDWSEDATAVDPSKIDWKAVAAGTKELPVRQRPGADNAMGKMKFMFPNRQGVYLHDTPDKDLFKEADRGASAGCVRVEDAPRLAKWLFGKPIKAKSKKPEQKVDMPEPVPVYITYLTAAPAGQHVSFRKDVYNRDGIEMARLRGALASR